MHIHVFGADEPTCARLDTTEEQIRDVVTRVIGRSGSDLVVLIYFVQGAGWDAEYRHGWVRASDVHRGTVPGLPPRFLLIRVALGENAYPYESIDDYGWTWRHATVLDHLAAVVAHELYHHTQPHFARRRMNNEADANRFAVQH